MNVPLLRQVQEQILREPDSFAMDHWVNENACGTVCCIAGWAVGVGLADQSRSAIYEALLLTEFDRLEIAIGSPPSVAIALLGIDRTEAARLFYASEWPENFRQAWETHYGSPKARAEVASARIDFFIATQGTDQEQPGHLDEQGLQDFLARRTAEVESVELVAADA